MDIKEFVKYELLGWKKHEIVGLFFVFLLILFNAFYLKDSKAAVISAFCGILYSTIAGNGKISCYFFGLMGTLFYSYLSLKNLLFGNLILYVGYYLPMQIWGIFAWKKNLKSSTKEIYKTNLSLKHNVLLFILVFICSLFAIAILKYLGDSRPIFDGVTTVLSILGMYLTVKRCIEQWIVWMVVNGLSSIMWLSLILQGTKAYSTFIMWSVYFVLAIYFYFVWKKDLQQ